MSGGDPDPCDGGLAEASAAAGFAVVDGTAVVPFASLRAGRPPAPSAGPERPSAASAPTRILLVDAIEEDVVLVRDLLARAEHGTYLLEHATDAQDALAKLLSGGHDVALIEQGLKGDDCLSFARAVGRRGLATPLIVLSEGAAPGLDLAAIDAGAADYLDKEELAVERLERAIRMALARQRRNARLDTPAQIDPLTGLASRHAYLDRLEQALGRARRRRTCTAVMLVDIDRFDTVNHRFGHGTGDSLLRLIGNRIRRQLRDTDTTARLDADRFALIVEELARPEHAATVALKLLTAVASPLAIASETVTVTASAGAAVYPEDAADAGGLLNLAEAALEQAKLAGGHQYCPPPDRQRPQPAGDAALAMALEQAIQNDHLTLLFQPQVTLCSADLGLGAIIRWPDASTEGMADDRVRALADAAALGEPLTDLLLAAACRQATRWRGGGLPALHVAVPLLSRRPLIWGDLARRIERHLASAGMAPAELELEIEESLLLDQSNKSGGPLAAVRELGVRLAIACYGAGPTPLGALRDLPLTTVKLAREMIVGVPDDRMRTAVTSGIVRLARDLGLRVVADGVETQSQLQLLRQLGCDAVQALICCPPLPADACSDWLTQAARRA